MARFSDGAVLLRCAVVRRLLYIIFSCVYLEGVAFISILTSSPDHSTVQRAQYFELILLLGAMDLFLCFSILLTSNYDTWILLF